MQQLYHGATKPCCKHRMAQIVARENRLISERRTKAKSPPRAKYWHRLVQRPTVTSSARMVRFATDACAVTEPESRSALRSRRKSRRRKAQEDRGSNYPCVDSEIQNDEEDHDEDFGIESSTSTFNEAPATHPPIIVANRATDS